jgi:hypothetical protein
MVFSNFSLQSLWNDKQVFFFWPPFDPTNPSWVLGQGVDV